jgi:hypothetical protein
MPKQAKRTPSKITLQFMQMSAWLCAAIETLSGARREQAED